MPKPKPTPGELPSSELVLAALERAQVHHDQPSVSQASVKRHLDLPHTGWTTRQLRPTWDALEAASLIERSKRSGIRTWALTPKGRKRLEAVRQAGKLGPLPESPQHRAWREAQVAASERIGEFQTHLRDELTATIGLLDAGEQPSSEWYDIVKRLAGACKRLASATYCLHEWAEPNDAHADIDDPPYAQVGRRATYGWDKH
jgi:DNA-binding PadR family transcriptional regulator